MLLESADSMLTLCDTGDPVGKAVLQEFAKEPTAPTAETPPQPIQAQLQVIGGLRPSDNGSFLSYNRA